MAKKMEMQADALYELLQDVAPQAITKPFACEELGLSGQQFVLAKRSVVSKLEADGAGQTVAGFTCSAASEAGSELHGTYTGSTWAYALVDSASADAMRFQHGHRTANVSARLETAALAVASLAHGVHGGTKLSKELKRMASRLDISREEIAEMDLPVDARGPVTGLPNVVLGEGASRSVLAGAAAGASAPSSDEAQI